MKIKKYALVAPAVLRVLFCALFALAFLFLQACSEESELNKKDTGEEGTEVILSLATGKSRPAASPSTYGLSMNEEVEISTVDVLSFLDDGSGTYYYEKTGSAQSQGGNEFKLRIGNHDKKQRFVVLANANAALTGLSFAPTDDLEDALQKLERTITGEWAGNSIPMYASTSAIKADTLTRINATLIRMLARIDVSVKSGIGFQLTNARLYNIPLNGRIAHSEAAADWDATNLKVLNPTLPVSAQKKEKPGTVFPADAAGIIRREIYTFEAGTPVNRDNATALVVGGLYGYPANTTDTTYYRIDIPVFSGGTEQPNTLGIILRNHLYDIEIQSVQAKGSATPDEAFYTYANLTSQIKDWDLGDIDEALFLGVNNLRVSQALFTLANNGESNQRLDISTSYDEGWEAWLVPQEASDWLTFTPAPNASRNPDFSGVTTTEANLLFNALVNNSGQDWRHAALKIRAGNLVKYIDFFQSDYRLESAIFDWETIPVEADTEIFRLGVSRAGFPLYRNKYDVLEVVASTDFPGGVEVYADYQDGTGWLSILGSSTFPTAGTHTVKFSVDQNDSGAPRTGYIVVKAGSLLKKIVVGQSLTVGPEVLPPVRPWDDPGFESGIPVIDFWLKTDRAGFHLYRNEYTDISLTAETNQPGGFEVYPEGGSWLSVIGNSQFAMGKHTVHFKADQNNTGFARTGYIVVNAGNLQKKVEITQELAFGPDGSRPIVDWKEAQIEMEIDPKDFRVNRTTCAYDGDQKSNVECLQVTAAAGRNWSATSDVSWLTVETLPSVGTGNPQSLFVSVAAYASGADRTGTISLQSGNLSKEITVTQYTGKGVQVSNVATSYGYNTDEPNEKHKFTLKTRSAWTAEVDTDTDNLIRQLHTPSNIANWSGTDFLFTLNPLTSSGGSKIATIRISSIWHEFNPLDVTVSAEYVDPYFELGGLLVKRKDQEAGKNWYVYANVPSGTNTPDVPPVGAQVSPAQEYSCASYKTDNASKPWRLPTETEMKAIFLDATAKGGTATYNLMKSYYWTATSVSTDVTKGVQIRPGGTTYDYQKTGTSTSDGARCVRDK